MALLRGKGAMTGVNLVAKVYKNGYTKNGKAVYADVQVDARDPRGPGQTNLHLKSERVKDKDDKVRNSNGALYSTGQMEDIVKAAGPNTEPLLDKDGEEAGALYGFKGNVRPATPGTGLVVNTKSLRASDFKVDGTTLDNQLVSMRDARDSRAAVRDSQAQASATEQTVDEVDEPVVG
ncbi:hypothetical protein [Streptomyces sp. NPDC056061]|uniref:hypothetical protein n=1 Tax=Streptomyces sp. NPDC056061 TaxID=3345700 RepID=UPI0035D732C6